MEGTRLLLDKVGRGRVHGLHTPRILRRKGSDNGCPIASKCSERFEIGLLVTCGKTRMSYCESEGLNDSPGCPHLRWNLSLRLLGRLEGTCYPFCCNRMTSWKESEDPRDHPEMPLRQDLQPARRAVSAIQ